MMMTLTENNEPDTSDLQPNKRRRKKSIVWEHFTVENVGDGCTRACCNQCKQTFAYSTGTKLSGTSHLKRHIAQGTCLANRRKERNQQKSSAPKTGSNGSVTYPSRRQYSRSSVSLSFRFDQELCRHELAKMIIMHEYPLHMVEHPGFISFVKTLQPQFNMVNFDTIQGDCVALYHKQKQELLDLVSGIPGRINLSVDLWTSSGPLGFVLFTGHFISKGWKLHSRILNAVMVPFPISKGALTRAVEICLGEWGLEDRIFSLTMDKSVFRDDIEGLKDYISVKNPLRLDGQLLIEHCFTHILSSSAQEALGRMQETINNVRKSIKFVKTSQANEHEFLDLKQKLQVPGQKCLSLDDQTQWDTTYLMLVAAVELKEVFLHLDTSLPDYHPTLSMDDWKQIETLSKYLELLHAAAKVVSSTMQPTADLFFHEVCKIQYELMKGAESKDPLVLNLTALLQQKFATYWTDCSRILAIAVVLDPQFKMKLVEVCFPKIYGDEASTYVKMVDEGIRELFSEYGNQFIPLSALIEQGSDVKLEEQLFEKEPIDGTLPGDDFFDPNTFMTELSGIFHAKSELDQYLEEPVIAFSLEFDILSWWDLNSHKYPVLSKMARDILSIPMSSVSPESAFATASKELNRYWTSLKPETVQALICAKDWLRYGSTGTESPHLKTEDSIL